MKESTGSSIFNAIFFVVIIAFLCSSIAYYTLYIAQWLNPVTYTLAMHDTPDDLSAADPVGFCNDAALGFFVDVYVVDSLESPADTVVTGRFYTEVPAIALVHADVNVVAHEVSHFVDYLMHRKGIEDGETRAYLQGYFTDCVYQIAQYAESQDQ